MSTFWKYFFVVFFILAVPVAAYFGYRSYRSLKNPSSPGFTAITEKAALIIEFREPRVFTEKLTRNTNFWRELTTLNEINDLQKSIIHLDSIFMSNNQIRDIYQKNKLFLCLQIASTGRIEPLFIYELPSIGYKFTIENFIKEINGEKSFVMQKRFQNVSITKLNIPGIERLFSFSVHKGIFIGAFEESLVKDAIEQMNTGIPVNQQEQFKKLEISAGINVDANVFLNYSNFADIVQTLTDGGHSVLIQNLKKMGNWSETDLILKPNELLLSGYTMTSGDGKHLLDLYRQEPQAIKIPEIVPHDVSVLFHFAYDDFNRYYEDQRNYRLQENLLKHSDSSLSILKLRMGLDVTEYFCPWIGHEVALAITGESSDTASNRYIIIHAKDIRAASDSVMRIAEVLNKYDKKGSYREEFEDYILRDLNAPGLFSVLFGSIFNDLDCLYYFTIRDYMVFANSPSALKYLIASFYAQKTLAVNPNFRSFSNGISDKSNILFYCNTRKSLNGIANFLAGNLAIGIKKHTEVFKTFEGIAVQYSFTGDRFYKSIFVRYNPDYQEEIPSGWETELAGEVIARPFLFRNDETAKLNVVVFDDLNNIYLTDHFGKIIWKTPLIEHPLSQVSLVDYYDNGKKQFLFNTQNYLYIIDPEGNYVADFPVKIMTPATNELKLLDKDQKRNYRIWLALSDNRIHNFDINARPIEGWQKVPASFKVRRPVEYLERDGTEFLFITDEGGNVSIVDLKGEPLIKVKKGFKKAINSIFYLNRTNNKGLFITTDVQGKLVYIDENGKIDRTDFGDYSPDHYFLYEDLTQNDSRDFIFIDGNKLIVYNRFKELVIEFEFPGNVTEKPVVFKGKGNEMLMGVLAAGKVYIFNKYGEIYRGNSFSGNTQFITGSLNSDGKINLIIGKGNRLVNYLLP